MNFGKANLCPAGQTATPPCSQSLTLTYKVTEGGTLGTAKVLTQGAPDLDFTLASGSTCTGAVTTGTTCTVNVKFAPKYPGSRPGAVQITGGSGRVLATTLTYGLGVGPQIGLSPGPVVILPSGGLDSYSPLAVAGDGDLFTQDYYDDASHIVKFPVGGGAKVQLPFTGLSEAYGIAVDGAGDVFVSGLWYLSGMNTYFYGVEELPSGGGAQKMISTPLTSPGHVAVDSAGDVFVADGGASQYDPPIPSQVFEFPAGGGPPIIVGTGWTQASGVAVDAAGDVFVLDNVTGNSSKVVEVPVGGGPQITLPFPYPDSGYNDLAVDAAGDVFVLTTDFDVVPYTTSILELPGAGGPPITISPPPYVSSMALGPAGDIFFIVPDQMETAPYQVTFKLAELQGSAAPTFNFGTTYFGSTLPLTIGNTGTATLTITPSFSNASYQVQSEQPDGCLPKLSPGETCTLQIGFLPGAGSNNGVLTLLSNTGSDPTAALQGPPLVNAPVFSPASGVYATAQSVSITIPIPGARIYYTTNGTVPTASSTPYTGPISVNSTETLTAIAFFDNVPSPLAPATYTIASGTRSDVLNFGQGFSAAKGPIQFNGSTDLDGSRLQLTQFTYSLNAQKGSAFYITPVDIAAFTTDFTFQLTDPEADGFTFTIQNAGVNALGNEGESLGYAPIGKSVAVKFDLYPFYNYKGADEGANTTGVYTDGALPTAPEVNLTGTGINLLSGDTFFAQITYDGTNLVLTLTDILSFATWSHSFPIDIPATVGGDTAFVGFTGSTGASSADQEILSWTYVSGPPGTSAPPPPIPSAPDYPTSFNPLGLVTNGSASLSGSALQLTDGGQKETGSAFYVTPVTVDQSFTTDFTFQLTNPATPQTAIADGFTFTILNAEPYIVPAGYNALGADGGALGYEGIVNNASAGYNNFDMAIKFDLHNNSGEGPNSTGVYVNGAPPTTPAVDLIGTGIDLHSGHIFKARVAYDYATKILTLTITDTVTLATWSHSFPVDIPTAIGGVTAYVGFTGATGSDVAVQQILNWTFTSP